MLIHVLDTALPVFIALFLGILCRRRNILSRDGVDTLKKVAVDITLPAVLFSAFASAEYTAQKLLIPLLFFVLCVAALALGLLLRRLFRIKSRLMPYLMTGFEAGMLGYGLFALLYPGQSNSGFALIDLGQVLFVFTVYKGLLMGKGRLKETFAEAARSPVLWAIIVGMIFGITGLYKLLQPSGVAGNIDSVAAFVAAPTSCLILITIGYDIQLKKTPWGRVAAYTGLRLAVMGLILAAMVFVNRHILGGIMDENALLLMLILPAPYVLPIFADVEAERTDIASTLSVMTLASLLLFSVMAAFAV